MPRDTKANTERYDLVTVIVLSAAVIVIAIYQAIVGVVRVAANSGIEITLPVPSQSIAPPAPVEGTVTATFSTTSADLVMDGLSPNMQFWMTLQAIVPGLAVSAVFVCLIVFAVQIAKGAAFSSLLTRLATITAVLVVVGGMGTQFLESMVNRGVIANVFGRESELLEARYPLGGLIGKYDYPWDLMPVVIGVAIAAVAVVFAHGERLKRDTEGLI